MFFFFRSAAVDIFRKREKRKGVLCEISYDLVQFKYPKMPGDSKTKFIVQEVGEAKGGGDFLTNNL